MSNTIRFISFLLGISLISLPAQSIVKNVSLRETQVIEKPALPETYQFDDYGLITHQRTDGLVISDFDMGMVVSRKPQYCRAVSVTINLSGVNKDFKLSRGSDEEYSAYLARIKKTKNERLASVAQQISDNFDNAVEHLKAEAESQYSQSSKLFIDRIELISELYTTLRPDDIQAYYDAQENYRQVRDYKDSEKGTKKHNSYLSQLENLLAASEPIRIFRRKIRENYVEIDKGRNLLAIEKIDIYAPRTEQEFVEQATDELGTPEIKLFFLFQRAVLGATEELLKKSILDDPQGPLWVRVGDALLDGIDSNDAKMKVGRAKTRSYSQKKCTPTRVNSFTFL